MNRLPQKNLLLTGILLLLFLANLGFGAVKIDMMEFITTLLQGGNLSHSNIAQFRLPRTLIALLVGMMLGLAGALVQGIIRNPLASPDILGVSHGAGLFAVLCILYLPSFTLVWLPTLAISGGLLAALILFLLCRGFSQPNKVALLGIALSGLFAALIDFLMLIHPLQANNAILWLTGSLWGRSWQHLMLLLPFTLLLPYALSKSHLLNLIALGDEKAVSLGSNIKRLKLTGFTTAIVLTSVSVAVCGPLTFLGLAAPHLARYIVGGRHQVMLPASMLVGANILLLADLLARTIQPPIELPAGVFTALIGAPYFLYLLLRLR